MFDFDHPKLAWTAVALTIVILGFHIYDVSVCTDRTSQKCRRIRSMYGPAGGVESRLYVLAIALGLIFIPLALSREFSTSSLMIATLATCVISSTYTLITGCFATGKKKPLLCRADIDKLLMFASCAALLSIPLSAYYGSQPSTSSMEFTTPTSQF